jgi:hypothetical protein
VELKYVAKKALKLTAIKHQKEQSEIYLTRRTFSHILWTSCSETLKKEARKKYMLQKVKCELKHSASKKMA